MSTEVADLHFVVYGHPEPQGSAKGFIPKGWSRPVITSDNAKLKPWRHTVTALAVAAMRDFAPDQAKPSEEAVAVRVRFYFSRPASVSRKVTRKVTKPDIDKCLRAILDGLSGVVFRDDSQVVSAHCEKLFGDPERAEIAITFLPVKGEGLLPVMNTTVKTLFEDRRSA